MTGGTACNFISNFGQDSSFAGNKAPQGNTDDNGVGDFFYAPPSGYLALCTANLPDPAIDPAQDDVPADYFNTVTYTGNGSTQSVTVGWQPDLIWGKARNAAFSHALHDAVRGFGNRLVSNDTAAESFRTDAFQATAVDSTGFNLGSQGDLNYSGNTMVAWNWLAGNGTSSNTDGSITSTVSVNEKAGFSIVSYTGNGTAGATIGHGLSNAPDVIIFKRRDAVTDWHLYHSSITNANTTLAYLNKTNAPASTNAFLNSTYPTSSLITLGTGAGLNGGSMLCYVFHSVEGYSKFGSYTGNGSNDGPFIYCGFRPALFLTKRTDSTSDWQLLDTSRDTYNAADAYLKPNTSGAEATGGPHDFVSNGFKIRNTGGSQNASGGTYIFMAFAENPFKYANAR